MGGAGLRAPMGAPRVAGSAPTGVQGHGRWPEGGLGHQGVAGDQGGPALATGGGAGAAEGRRGALETARAWEADWGCRGTRKVQQGPGRLGNGGKGPQGPGRTMEGVAPEAGDYPLQKFRNFLHELHRVPMQPKALIPIDVGAHQ